MGKDQSFFQNFLNELPSEVVPQFVDLNKRAANIYAFFTVKFPFIVSTQTILFASKVALKGILLINSAS